VKMIYGEGSFKSGMNCERQKMAKVVMMEVMIWHEQCGENCEAESRG